MSATEVISRSRSDTFSLAEALAVIVKPGDCITLSGEVGAGKTTFAQGFIGALLEVPEGITSPTFTLLQHYQGKHGLRILHADLYRLESPAELAEIGLEEALGNHVTLIEWPEIAYELLPADALHIRLEYCDEQQRKVTLHSAADRWDIFLEQVAE